MPKREPSERIALADTVISESPSDPGMVSSPRTNLDNPESVVGARVDHFQIEELIGSGGMGAVYLAHDVSLDRKVAIKMMRAALASPDYEERLMREARAQAKVQHPNVVGIHYIGRAHPVGHETDTAPLYFAMECVDGDTLEAHVEKGDPMEPEAARVAMLQVARGLRAAQRVGIIHRDIKPSNLLRDREGTIHIADFGLAKPVEADVSITQEGAFVGSPLYMSPEQASDDPLDHRSDMYSIGATFYHLLAGHPPFDGRSPMKVIAKHLSKEVPPLAEAAPQVPGALQRIVHQLLAKEPGDRFEDYDELIEAIQAAAPGRAPHAGFWIRSAGVLIDAILAACLIALFGWPGAFLHLMHIAIGHALWGQTLAKYLLRIRVQRPDGSAIGFRRSIARTVLSLWMPIALGAAIWFSEGFGGLTTTIEQLRIGEMGRLQDVLVAIAVGNGVLSLLYAGGLVLAAFHNKKRSMHDMLTDTVVRYVLPEE
ncbi:MAG: protein kinase [Myxococcota bacterium]